MQVNVIPVSTGTSGSLSQLFKKFLEDIPGKHSSVERGRQPFWEQQTSLRISNVFFRGY